MLVSFSIVANIIFYEVKYLLSRKNFFKHTNYSKTLEFVLIKKQTCNVVGFFDILIIKQLNK